MPEREAWERQPSESRKAYTAFCIYRDLGPRERSLIETARRYYLDRTRKRPVQVGVWSSKYNWVSRCKAYDEFIDEQRRQQALDEILEMAGRQAREGTQLQALGLKILQKISAQDPSGNVLDVVRALRTGAEIERLARGMPTAIVEEQGKERDMVVIEWRGEKEQSKAE